MIDVDPKTVGTFYLKNVKFMNKNASYLLLFFKTIYFR